MNILHRGIPLYERILIPTDGSTVAKRAAEHGVNLAASLGAEVHALYVIEEGGNPWLSESMEDQMEQAESFGEEIVGDVADLAAEAGVDSVTEITASPAVFEEINEYVEENDIDAIVLGSGYKGTMGGLLGSTASKVIRTADVPVISLRKGEVQ